MKPVFRYIHNNLPSDFIPSQPNPFHNLAHYFRQTNSTLSLSLQLGFPSDLFLSDFAIKICMHLANLECASFPQYFP
jgi:hypothetical protein